MLRGEEQGLDAWAGGFMGGAGRAAAAQQGVAKRNQAQHHRITQPDTVNEALYAMEAPPEEHHFWARFARTMKQKEVRAAYMNTKVQWSIAGLIMGNFITNIVEKQIDPWNEFYAPEWFIIEFAWNVVFILELAWNMYSCVHVTTFKGNFFTSSWNLFDLLVVTISIPSMTGADLGSFSQLRMLRAFRVFRLFKRIKSLNRILVSLLAAVPGLVNAAVVMILFMYVQGRLVPGDPHHP